MVLYENLVIFVTFIANQNQGHDVLPRKHCRRVRTEVRTPAERLRYSVFGPGPLLPRFRIYPAVVARNVERRTIGSEKGTLETIALLGEG